MQPMPRADVSLLVQQARPAVPKNEEIAVVYQARREIPLADVRRRRIRLGRRCEQGATAPLAPAPRPHAMPVDPASELVLPSLAVRVLVRRAVAPTALAAVVVVALVVAGGPLQTFADALGRALGADPRWVAAAVAFELLSFAGYVALLWLVGGRATPRLGFRASAEVTLGGAAATRLLPTGGVGGAALTLWAFRRTGLDARTATRTLLTFLVLLYAVFLVAIAAAGGTLALGLAESDGPVALSALPAGGAALAIVAALALAARAAAQADPPATSTDRTRGARVRAAVGSAPATIGLAVRDALVLLRSADVRLLGAPAWWLFDATVLWAMFHALGAPPSVAVIVLGYFVGQLANTIPIPGAVSGGMVGVLLAFGVEADLALASVLAYRSVAIWLPAPMGVAAMGGLRSTVARWAREDAAECPAAQQLAIAVPAWRRPDAVGQAAA
jgi:uncharacterized membrane protein YbhN (UPF0104 family)